MMMRGWKLEYIDHCRNSTHCPELFTEFLRQRRRWVLSELSNMALIFQHLVTLIRNNANFSVIFILSLLQMFLWVLVSPSTTLFILSLSYEILFGVPVLVAIPVTHAALLCYAVVCCVGSRRTQNSVTLVFLAVIALLMLSVGAAFIKYVVDSIQEDMIQGEFQFKPYFLVLLLVSGTIYAALVHPGEWQNLVYGVAYAFMFPAMFVILPVYSVANMVDQSWGTREKATRLGDYWCGSINAEKDSEKIETEAARLPVLTPKTSVAKSELQFWESLKSSLLGTTVNCGRETEWLHHSLTKLRNKCITLTLLLNTVWLGVLSCLYLFANTDIICYVVAGVFSFSLVVQLVGLTSYKIDNCLRRHIIRKVGSSHQIWVKERH
ncbi:chitin synthase chs-2-like [Gigantopelta aegis]|uniref:chitin synthase chs-2-like n=1 Tax=Gigantopelta aegis TaxID=1735272 RepID=UPI001B88B822|nr:chitin synthase chs-2-like [Gigantopelta aegis]